MARRKGRALRAFVVCVVALTGCSRSEPARDVTLKPVALPDLTRLAPNVREQLRARHAAMTRVIDNPNASPSERANAYGEAGMTLMAAEYSSEAEVAFTNAETLAPSDLRWPYYLGHLHRQAGRAEQAAAAFQRALTADPNYVPAQIWLGNTYLDLARPEEAERLFRQALASGPHTNAASFGLGRAALARREYADAVRHLEQVLAADPAAEAAHYPLALAYRGFGDEARAEAHARQRGQTPDVPPPDPLREELDLQFESAVAHEVRGARLLDEGKWPEAVEQFRKGLALAPGSPALGHKYGTALAMSGDMAAARRAFEDVVRRSPDFAKAHYSLGLIKASAGDIRGAEQSWAAALRAEPNYVEARLQLAHALRRTGRAAAALPHYQRLVEADPRVQEAHFGLAMSLVMGRRYAEARDRLAAAAQLHPGQTAFTLALARLLAAAPDAAVRDGARALMLLDAVPEDRRTVEWAEVRAMALAEAGRFDEAVQVQQEVVARAEQAGARDVVPGMRQALAHYGRRQPLRTPWPPDEPMEMPESR